MSNAVAPPAPAADPMHRLLVELERQMGTKRDVRLDTRRMSLTAPSRLDWPTNAKGALVPPAPTFVLDHPKEGALEFGVTDHAHGQIASALDIPVKTYRRLVADHPDLLANLTNGLLSREPKKQMVRLLDGRVRAYLSPVYRPRDNWDLVKEAILPSLAEHGDRGLVFKACELTETRMYVKIVLPDFEEQITPRVGDVVRGGLIVKNSEVGSGSLLVAPYTDVLWCTNGAVHAEYGQAQRHVGSRIEEESWDLYSESTLRKDDEAFFAKCRDTVKAVLDRTVFDAIVAQMRDLAGIPLANPVGAVEDVTRKHDLSEAESKAVLSALVTDYAATGWGLVNALTQTARDLESPDRRVELETLAGALTSDWTLAGVR